MRRVALVVLGCLAFAGTPGAQEPGKPGQVAALQSIGAHAVWVPDRVLEHSLLYDGDTGDILGMIDTGISITPKPPLLSRRRGEIYSVDIVYSRGKRGDRLDLVTIYDAKSLQPTGEIILPTRTGESNASLGYTALLDGERFLLTYNQAPVTSVSVVDLDARRFVGEIAIAGCAGVYPAGALRFATLCGDGTVTQVDLDPEGRKQALTRSARFFDPVKDPVMMSAGRDGARWTFVTFEGNAREVREVDFSGATPRVEPAWALIGKGERDKKWRVGGLQHVALHRGSKRLFVIVHQGGPGSHKDPGREIWVYDLTRRARVGRFEVPNLAGAFFGTLLEAEEGSFVERMLKFAIPNQGVHAIAVTQDDAPLLFMRHDEVGLVGVLDARTGKHLRTLSEAGITGPTLEVP
jgi:methylamine dehydrogenase heavy chain